MCSVHKGCIIHMRRLRGFPRKAYGEIPNAADGDMEMSDGEASEEEDQTQDEEVTKLC